SPKGFLGESCTIFVIVGTIMVFVCVFGAFAAHGGNLGVLWQPAELVIIFGAAAGSLMISTPVPVLKLIVSLSVKSIQGKTPNKVEYTELLMLLFELTKTAKGNLLALEAHVENPENSDIFKRYPGVLHIHHAIDFIADTMKVQ